MRVASALQQKRAGSTDPTTTNTHTSTILLSNPVHLKQLNCFSSELKVSQCSVQQIFSLHFGAQWLFLAHLHVSQAAVCQAGGSLCDSEWPWITCNTRGSTLFTDSGGYDPAYMLHFVLTLIITHIYLYLEVHHCLKTTVEGHWFESQWVEYVDTILYCIV